MEPGSSLPPSEDTANCPYPESQQFSSLPPSEDTANCPYPESQQFSSLVLEASS